ncbi:MAG: hypothetical protein RTU30_12000 [Candidatus Thorarchaeota archaeon]
MTLFEDSEIKQIRQTIESKNGTVLITFRNPYGPTRLEKLWKEILSDMGISINCINWWSSAGTVGLLECETSEGRSIFGQWALSDKTELLGVFEVDDDEIANIRDGFDAGNVTSAAMRVYRIGETGDRD